MLKFYDNTYTNKKPNGRKTHSSLEIYLAKRFTFNNSLRYYVTSGHKSASLNGLHQVWPSSQRLLVHLKNTSSFHNRYLHIRFQDITVYVITWKLCFSA